METLKVCFVGGEQSGKTALITRLLFDEFDETYGPTLEDNYRHTFFVGFQERFVDILDVGGLDLYSTEYDRWFGAADAFVFVYNIGDEDSFKKLRSFRDEIQRVKKKEGITLKQVPMLLIGTQLDRERHIAETMGRKMSEALGCPFFETTAQIDATQIANKSSCCIAPASIIDHLIQEQAKRNRFKMLDELSVQTPEKTLRKARSVQDVAQPPLSLFEEITEKWKRPIDKLPVFIDFPRLANKISVVMGEKERRPKRNPDDKPVLLRHGSLTVAAPQLSKLLHRSPSPLPDPKRSGSPKLEKQLKRGSVAKEEKTEKLEKLEKSEKKAKKRKERR